MLNIKKRWKIILPLVIIIAMIVVPLLSEFGQNYFIKMGLDDAKIPEKDKKLLIIAPHNDDESLGTAQLIKKSLENGADVRVVVVTNGDGYTEALDIHDKKIFAKPSDYIAFGYERQGETVDAMTSLGVKKEYIYFLGYPDGGISHLWEESFYVPYKSKYTKVDASPYKDSYTKGATYTGESLLKDLESILTTVNPDYMAYPHSNDRHPDHWAVNGFVTYALKKTGQDPEKEYLYLVHRGDWPVPMTLDKNRFLLPPYKLKKSGTIWYSLDINPDEADEKEQVIRKYKSQFPTLKNLMLAFVRKNELFGIYPDVDLTRDAVGDQDMLLSDKNQLISDPVDDAIRLDFSKGADITGIYGGISTKNNLNLFISSEEEIGERIIYMLDIIWLKDRESSQMVIKVQGRKVETQDKKGNILKGPTASLGEKYIHIIIPKEMYEGSSSMLISGSTFRKNIRIDHTALRSVKLTPK